MYGMVPRILPIVVLVGLWPAQHAVAQRPGVSTVLEELRRCALGLCDAGPVIAAEANRSSGVPGTEFRLQGVVSDPTVPVRSWRWFLGDGRELNGREVAVQYANPGNYEVRLRGTAADGSEAETALSITVFDPNATAPPGLPFSQRLGDLDDDGRVRLDDLLQATQEAVGLTGMATAEALEAADLDLDGETSLEDARLIALAVAAGQTLPNVLLPAQGVPGTRVSLISPALLDPGARITVEVGDSGSVQEPVRVVRGYGTFVVPFDLAAPGDFNVSPGPVEVRVLSEGAVVQRLSFEVQAPAPLPADPKGELRSFLSDYEAVLGVTETVLQGQLDALAVSGQERQILLGLVSGSREELSDSLERLKSFLELPGGEEMAKLFFAASDPDQLRTLRSKMAKVRELAKDLGPDNVAPALGRQVDPGQVCSQLVPAVCSLRELGQIISTADEILSDVCDLLLLAVVGAIVSPFDGFFGDAVAIAGWASTCLGGSTLVGLLQEVTGFATKLKPELRFQSSTSNLGAGETAELRAEVRLTGFNELCNTSLTGGLIDQLSKRIAKRLVRKIPVLQVAAVVLNNLGGQRLSERLEALVAGQVAQAINLARIEDAIAFLNTSVCSFVGDSADLPIDLSAVLQDPDPNTGTLTFEDGGAVGRYRCPTTGSTPEVRFTVSKTLCSGRRFQNVTIACGGGDVTITMGDNGSLLDDIFEVRVNGMTVLTSSVPVRQISTTLALPSGSHDVSMLGRAAPDGIGTYFISFDGIASVSGDPLSGTDLTPGVVKQFAIVVP